MTIPLAQQLLLNDLFDNDLAEQTTNERRVRLTNAALAEIIAEYAPAPVPFDREDYWDLLAFKLSAGWAEHVMKENN